MGTRFDDDYNYLLPNLKQIITLIASKVYKYSYYNFDITPFKEKRNKITASCYFISLKYSLRYPPTRSLLSIIK